MQIPPPEPDTKVGRKVNEREQTKGLLSTSASVWAHLPHMHSQMHTHLNFNYLNNALDMLRIWAVQKGQVGIRKRLFPTPLILDPKMFLLVLAKIR